MNKHKDFVSTAVILDHQVKYTIEAVLKHYKWTKFGVIVQDDGTNAYMKQYNDVKTYFGDNVLVNVSLKSDPYRDMVDKDLSEKIKRIKKHSRSMFYFAFYTLLLCTPT